MTFCFLAVSVSDAESMWTEPFKLSEVSLDIQRKNSCPITASIVET